MNRIKFVLYFFLMLSLISGLQVVAFAGQAESKGESKLIKSSGCVEPGVEAGCLVLMKNKKVVYNLFFKTDKKPTVGTAISFTGNVHEGPTTCMQGTSVDVTEWKPIRMLCPALPEKK